MEEFTKIMDELAEKGQQCLDDIENWYKEFESWKECIIEDLDRIRNNKGCQSKVVPFIPTTPAASKKKKTRRKLSTVQELCMPEEEENICSEDKPQRRARRIASNRIQEQCIPVRRSKRAHPTSDAELKSKTGKEGCGEPQSANDNEDTTSEGLNKGSAFEFRAPSVIPERASTRASKRKRNTKNKGLTLSSDDERDTERTSKKEKAETLPEKYENSTGTSRESVPNNKRVSARNRKNTRSIRKNELVKSSDDEEVTSDKVEVVETAANKENNENSSNHRIAETSDKEALSSPILQEKKSSKKRSLHVPIKRLSETIISNYLHQKESPKESSQISSKRQTLSSHAKSHSSSEEELQKKETNAKPSHSEEISDVEIMESKDHCKDKEESETSSENNRVTEINCSYEEYKSCCDLQDVIEDKFEKIVPSSGKSNSVCKETKEQMSSNLVNTTHKDRDDLKVIIPKTAKSPVLFSPYANDTVKKRVAAYETLRAVPEESEKEASPVRMTRTKTRALAAKQTASKNRENNNTSELRTNQMHKLARASLNRAIKRLANQKNDSITDLSKENSVPPGTSVIHGKTMKRTPLPPSKVLSDINSFSVNMNSSRKTPLTGGYLTGNVNSSATQLNKSNNSKPGVIVTNVHTFIKKKTKVVPDLESVKLEEQRRREEKEKEALKRREELMKKRAEQQKKQDEKRIKVLQNREAQEKEKQESQLRLGREKDEKLVHILQQREAKQKEELLRKKQEAERKAAEARRKIEEAEAARLAKIKLEEQQRKKDQEEQQRKKEQEESEMQRQALKCIAEEKEAAAKREKMEQQKETTTNTVPKVDQIKLPSKEILDTTFTKPKANPKNNVYNLADIDTDESSGEESSQPKATAPWARRQQLLHKSDFELGFNSLAEKFFSCPKKPMDLTKIFKSHVRREYKRTSSAIWHTPPRYSQLPKY